MIVTVLKKFLKPAMFCHLTVLILLRLDKAKSPKLTQNKRLLQISLHCSTYFECETGNENAENCKKSHQTN